MRGGVRAELRLQLRAVRAEQRGGLLTCQMGRVPGLRLREHLFLQGQLRAGRVQLAAVRPVDALPARAAQRVGDTRPLGGVQPQHLLPGFPGQRPAGQVFQKAPRVLLARACGVVGQVLADARDQVRAAPCGA